MRIRLRGRERETIGQAESGLGETRAGATAPVPGGGAVAAALATRVSPRRFSKLAAAAAGAAALGLLGARPRAATAAYVEGAGGDTVNTNLAVQGTLTTTGNVAVGGIAPTAVRLAINGGNSDCLQLFSTDNHVWRVGPNAGPGVGFGIHDESAGQVRLRITLDGHVAIGTITPEARLHVRGPNNWEGTVRAEADTAAAYVSYGWYAAGTRRWSAYSHPGTTPAHSLVFNAAGGGDVATLTQGGSLGLGLTYPQNRLHLSDGGITIGTRLIADAGGAYYAP